MKINILLLGVFFKMNAIGFSMENIIQLQNNFVNKKQMLIHLKDSLSIKEDQDFITGVWLNGTKRAKIEFFKTDSGTYAGKIIWLKEPIDPITQKPKLDKFNIDSTKQIFPILGAITFKDFRYEGDGFWSKGFGYDPGNGKTYNGKIRMDIEEGNINVLKLIGYYKTPLFRRKSKWTRVAF